MKESIKKKFDSIDKSKIKVESTKEFLGKLEKGLNSKTQENADKAEALLDKFIAQAKAKNADIFVSNKPAPTLTPTAKKKANQVVKSKLDSLMDTIANDPLLKDFNNSRRTKGGGKSDPLIDSERKAIQSGPRISKQGWKNQYGKSTGGRKYYEYRENRIDRKAPNYGSRPWLKEGGFIHPSDANADKYVVVEIKADGSRREHNHFGDLETARMFASLKREFLPKGSQLMIEDKNGKNLYRSFKSGGYMADGGMMAKGGVIEEGDDVFVKPEKLNAEVVRITGENVVVEFYNRRPEGGEKRGNYKIKDLKKMANGGMMAKGGKAYYLKPQENIDKLFERQKKRLADMKRNDDQLMLLQGINYLNKKNDEDEEKYVILFFESETPFTRFDLEYHREKLIKLGYLADIDETYLVTPKGEEYLKQHNEKELARKMANGGMMAKGGVIEEGDDVFVKPEKLNAEVVRITGENVVVEFYDRRPEGGEKRGNYKIKDLKKLANGGMMADGGKVRWQDVYVGDNALVIAENKMGMVVKPYGRRFHLKFPDGSEKTYSAEELEFFKDEEFAKGGYTNKRNVLSLVVKNPNKNGIKKYLSINPKDFLDGLHEYAKGGKLTDDYTYIKRSEVEHVIYRDSNGKEQLDFKPKNGFWVSKKALVDAGMNETKAKFDAKEVANELTALSNKAWDTLSIQSGSEIYASDDLQENLADEYRKVGIDKIYGQLTQPERKKVSAVLTDENEHSLRNYLALRGYNGEAEFKNYAKMYDESFAKFGYRSNWNPKNVDLKLGSFAKGGMMTDDEGNSINLKVGDKVVEYKRPSSDKPKKQYGGQGEIISINGAMAKVFFDSTNYEKFYPLKDLKKMANGGMMAKGGTIADGEKLPEDMGRYFIKTSKTKVVNMSDLIPLRKRATGIANAEKNMKMAYDGEMDKRKPITIYKSQRKYRIMDGNSTYAVAKANGWETIWAEIVKNPNMKNGLKRTDDIFSRAKSIRKEGEAWKDALQRAKAMK